jgi:1-acyl-sn-glycerol-3-phosphate acyltransferase
MIRLFAVKVTLFLLVAVGYIPVWVASLFVRRHKRAYFWRQCAIVVIRCAFFCGGVRVRTSNNSFEDEPLVYASNHPSEMDGFALQMLLGPNVIPIIAPHQQFPFLIALWLKGMGAIDVVRDDVDNALYRGSNTKRQALHKAVQAIKQGYSILIFPEGHTELIEALYMFHTGASRIAHAAQVPIQTVIIKDAHRVFSNTFRVNTHTVTVEFGKSFTPKQGYDEKVLFTSNPEDRAVIIAQTEALEHEVLSKLPLRSVHDQREERADVGVFVDIDLTIYRSLSQMDFLMDLTKQGFIPLSNFMRIVYLFMLEKVHLVSHDHLMKEAMKLLSGWRIDTLDRLIKRFFRELALPKLEYGLFAILEDHLAKKHHVVFVTEVMHPVAEAFVQFFHADKAIDTSLQKRGLTYTGEITLLCRDKAKKDAVEEFIKEHGIDAKKSYAYADSFTDVGFLTRVAHPMAVNPDHKLRVYAKENHMPILKKHA